MITDDMIVYLLGQLLMLMFSLIGRSRKIPLLMILGLMGTLILAVPTIIAFQEYYLIALMLCLVNISFPAVAIAHSWGQD